MDAIPLDTTVEAARKEFEIVRNLRPEVRLRMALELTDTLRSIVESGVRLRHPDYDEQEVSREVARLMIGDKVFQEAFGGSEGPTPQAGGNKAE